MLSPFDPNDYRKRVLAAVLARGGGAASDPFELYDLPLEQAERLDDAAVAARLEEVWGFWQRHRDHPKFGPLAADLVADHTARSRLLLPAGHRAATADAVRRDRASRDTDRFALLDSAISALVDRHGGVPKDKVDSLLKLARSVGLTEAEASARLAGHHLLEATPVPVPVVGAVATDDRRRQIRSLLDELGAIWDCAPPVTLFALLDLEPDADDRQIAIAADAYRSRAREMPPHRLRTVLDEVLAHVSDLLERGPLVRERYLDSVAIEVAERLRPRALAAALVEDRLTAADAEVLAAEARDLGLDPLRASRVPFDLARDFGVPIEAPTPSARVVGSAPAPGRIDYRKREASYVAPLKKARARCARGNSTRRAGGSSGQSPPRAPSRRRR